MEEPEIIISPEEDPPEPKHPLTSIDRVVREKVHERLRSERLKKLRNMLLHADELHGFSKLPFILSVRRIVANTTWVDAVACVLVFLSVLCIELFVSRCILIPILRHLKYTGAVVPFWLRLIMVRSVVYGGKEGK